jgi:pyridoxine 5'-phosphate synthase PdxJ
VHDSNKARESIQIAASNLLVLALGIEATQIHGLDCSNFEAVASIFVVSVKPCSTAHLVVGCSLGLGLWSMEQPS